MTSKAKAKPKAAKPKAVFVPGQHWPEETQAGHPKKGSMMNALAAVERLGLDCSHDQFLDTYTIHGSQMQLMAGDLSDKVARHFRVLSHLKLGYEPGAEAAREGLMKACELHMHNSLMDYLDPLPAKWDRIERLDTWLTVYAGVKDTPLHRVWGALVLMAAVQRVYNPGCKFDHVLVLEGFEGKDKSTLVKVLASGTGAEDRPKYFSDSTILDKDEKQQQELTKGVWFYELSELSGSSRADQKKLKAFITRQEDRARAAYAYFKVNQPRLAVFIGTINVDEITGETIGYLNVGDRRRWWPARVEGKIDIPALIRDRDQLFAEAMIRGIADMKRFELAQSGDADMWDVMYGGKIGDGVWHSLKLPEDQWEAAKVEQVEREIPDTLVTVLSNLCDDIENRRGVFSKPSTYSVGDQRRAVEDRDFDVTTYPNHVWVSAAEVQKHVPTNIRDGRSIAAAMGANEWEQSRHGHDRTRGYLHRHTQPQKPLNIAPEFSEPTPKPADYDEDDFLS